jgi:hypothetical protein
MLYNPVLQCGWKTNRPLTRAGTDLLTPLKILRLTRLQERSVPCSLIFSLV